MDFILEQILYWNKRETESLVKALIRPGSTDRSVGWIVDWTGLTEMEDAWILSQNLPLAQAPPSRSLSGVLALLSYYCNTLVG